MENDCIFCKLIKGDIPSKKVTESANFVVIKDVYPKVEGHSLVIPKEHCEFIEELSEKSLKKTFHIVTKMAGTIRKNYGDCHILINNGKNAEQYIKHVHFHIIPKTSKKSPLWHDLSHEEFENISAELSKIFQNTH